MMVATKRPPRPGEGRPLKYKTVKQLQEAVDQFFAERPEEKWTISGLALALDVETETLRRYENTRPEFYATIKRAKQKIESSYEEDLKKEGRAGTIFALKNFGWTDKQERDVKLSGDADFLTALRESGRTEE